MSVILCPTFCSQTMILRNHGIVVCGETIEEAMYLAYASVKACQHQVKIAFFFFFFFFFEKIQIRIFEIMTWAFLGGKIKKKVFLTSGFPCKMVNNSYRTWPSQLNHLLAPLSSSGGSRKKVDFCANVQHENYTHPKRYFIEIVRTYPIRLNAFWVWK